MPNFYRSTKGALAAADKAVVFYSPEAVKIKQLKQASKEQVSAAFDRKDIQIFTEPIAFQEYLFQQKLENTALLLMSSGNYGGLDF